MIRRLLIAAIIALAIAGVWWLEAGIPADGATPPYSPWAAGPFPIKRGQVMLFRIHIRNNTDAPLRIQGGLSWIGINKNGASAMSVGNHFPVIKSNIPFATGRRLCGCLGKSWIVTIQPGRRKDYYFVMRDIAAKYRHFIVDANFYAPHSGYALRVRRNMYTASGTA